MVIDGKIIWNDTVKPNWIRANSSAVIPNIAALSRLTRVRPSALANRSPWKVRVAFEVSPRRSSSTLRQRRHAQSFRSRLSKTRNNWRKARSADAQPDDKPDRHISGGWLGGPIKVDQFWRSPAFAYRQATLGKNP